MQIVVQRQQGWGHMESVGETEEKVQAEEIGE